ncbi:MAG: hypothetical protein QXW79_00835 [Thermoplasmata archaeon]
MNPLIYPLPIVDDNIKIEKDIIHFDILPAPKLIKYGFNSYLENFDPVDLISVPNQRAIFNYDFLRKDEQSMAFLAIQKLGAKNFDQIFAEFWEIIMMFEFFEKDQTILTNYQDTLHNIIGTYKKLLGKRRNIKLLKDGRGNNISLVIYKFSEIDLEENAFIHLLINILPKLLSGQKKGSSMVLQIFGLQTEIMVELIYYLCSLYHNCYIMKPSVSSDLSNNKYLILISLKKPIKISLPKFPSDHYLISIGFSSSLPVSFTSVIQCMNSEFISRKLKKYHEVKKFIESKIYEGATYQDLIIRQNENAEKWFELFGDPKKVRKIFEEIVGNVTTLCSIYLEKI